MQSEYLTVRQLSQKHPAFPEGGLRWFIFNEHQNGFAKCVRRVGRKVLISEVDFLEWIDSQNGGQK